MNDLKLALETMQRLDKMIGGLDDRPIPEDPLKWAFVELVKGTCWTQPRTNQIFDVLLIHNEADFNSLKEYHEYLDDKWNDAKRIEQIYEELTRSTNDNC